MKCLVVLWFLTTGEMKEMTFHAPSCEVIYKMVEAKVKSENVQVLMISEESNDD